MTPGTGSGDAGSAESFTYHRAEGDWLGELMIDGDAHQAHLTLWRRDGHLGGVVDLPSMSAFGIRLELVAQGPMAFTLSFTNPNGTWSAGAWIFACQAQPRGLACVAMHGRIRAPFEMTKVPLRAGDGRIAEGYAGYYDGGGETAILARAGSHLLRTDGALPVELYPISEASFTSDGKDLVVFEGNTAIRIGEHPFRVCRAELPYTTREITFASGAVKLRGTLRTPREGGAHPAVALVHGSAPGEGYHPYFEVIADHFARHGVAVLAYDKRGWGLSGGDWKTASFEDLASDSLAATHELQRQPQIDAHRVGLWGISQGGWILPLAASRSRDVAFLILASAAAASPAQQELARVENEMRADGMPPHLIDEALAFERLFVNVALNGRGRDDLQRAMREAQGREWARYPAVLQVSESESAVDAVLRIAGEARDPGTTLGRVACPVLAIYGALDQTVRMDDNSRLLQQALREGGNSDVSVVVVQGADHAFFPTRTGGRLELLESAAKRIAFAPGFLQQMTNWLTRRIIPDQAAN
jgi:dienelactone hydrolase